MKIKTIRNLKDLEIVRNYWERWQDHPNTDFSHFELVCKLRQKFVSPYVTVIERDGELCGLLIARFEKTNIVPLVGYLKVIRIPARILIILHQGVIGQVDNEVAKLLVQRLRMILSSGEVDMICLNRLPRNSPLMSAFEENGPKLSYNSKSEASKHWTMTIPGEPNGLLKQMRSKHRSWIKNRQRKMETAFPRLLTWRWMSDFDDLPLLCTRIECLAARTYQRGLGAGFVNDEECRQRFSLFADRKQLRIQLLELDGQIRAFWVGIIYMDTFHSWSTGYDPDLSKYEIGTLLFLRMIDELQKEGVRKLDFGLGDAFYKQRFGDNCWREDTVRMFAPSAKGVFFSLTLRVFDILDVTIRRLLQHAELIDKLKALWRKYLAPSA